MQCGFISVGIAGIDCLLAFLIDQKGQCSVQQRTRETIRCIFGDENYTKLGLFMIFKTSRLLARYG